MKERARERERERENTNIAQCNCNSSKMPPAAEAAADFGYWGIPTATIDWCEENYEVRSSEWFCQV